MVMTRRYNIYPSLLDSFFGYLKAEETYNKFWGFSENPRMTLEEYLAKEEQEFFDRINRVPKDAPHADLGTCFNEIVDCIHEGRKSEVCSVERVYDASGMVTHLRAGLNGRLYYFPIDICRQTAGLFSGALTQVFVEGELETARGVVRLYGYIDELLPHSVSDIKTTKKYEPFKYKGNNQHLVYPFCLNEMGNKVRDFDYNIVVFNHNIDANHPEQREIMCNFEEIKTEHYTYEHERDIPILRDRCEQLIDFLEENNDRITARKIFNEA